MSTDTQPVSRGRSSSGGFGRFCQSILLLLIRIYFFLQLFKIGRAKLEHIDTVIGYFTKLGIPYPDINAWVVGATECFGGILILAGLASRLAAIPVTIAMAVAYWLGDQDAVLNIWGHPDKFVKAAPFPFFLAALIILCFGPGWFSLDAILGRLFRRKSEE
ncbi:MAG TPA: DoxX family protein [Chthoniobacterales bacterium]|nr:DoxX family protein [Chthoniobacterales bacterium]